MNDFEKIEKYLDKQEILKFSNIDTIKHKSVLDLLKEFFELNTKQETVFLKTNILQCSRGRSRSIGDIYRICKFYHSDLRMEELRDSLVELVCIGHPVRSIICGDVHMRVWRKAGYANFLCFPIDEFGLKYDVKKMGENRCSMLTLYKAALNMIKF